MTMIMIMFVCISAYIRQNNLFNLITKQREIKYFTAKQEQRKN